MEIGRQREREKLFLSRVSLSSRENETQTGHWSHPSFPLSHFHFHFHPIAHSDRDTMMIIIIIKIIIPLARFIFHIFFEFSPPLECLIDGECPSLASFRGWLFYSRERERGRDGENVVSVRLHLNHLTGFPFPFYVDLTSLLCLLSASRNSPISIEKLHF